MVSEKMTSEENFVIDYLSALDRELEGTQIEIVATDVTGSTNYDAKKYAADCDGDCPVLLVTGSQSAGRGRLGRSFLCRDGQGIYMSLLYFTEDKLTDAVSITTAAAVAVALSIEEVTGEGMKIKWVNDVYSSRGKVCGILVETLRVGERYAVIVGIGINTGDEPFPEDLRGIAASIGKTDPEEKALIVSKTVKRLLEHSEYHTDRSYMVNYRERFMLSGESVDLVVDGKVVRSGTVMGVSDDGGLLLRVGQEELTVHSGEVSVRRHGQ